MHWNFSAILGAITSKQAYQPTKRENLEITIAYHPNHIVPFVLENNESVIKMVIKGRMKNVSKR